MYENTPASRRYLWRVSLTLPAYVVLLVLVKWILGHYRLEGLGLYAVAILPAFAVAGAVLAMGLYLADETDEYVRMQTVKIMLVATGVTLVVSSIYGLLETHAGFPHVAAHNAFLLWCVGLVFGAAYAGQT